MGMPFEKRNLAISMLVLLLLLMPNLSFANAIRQQIRQQANQTILQIAYGQVSCKTNFTVAFATNAEAVIPNSTAIKSSVLALEQDTSELQNYSNQGNIIPYRSYVAGTYDPQLRAMSVSIRSSIRSANLSSSQISTLRSQYSTLMATLRQCNFNALKLYANEKVSIYQQIVGQYQNRTSALGANGLNTAALNQIVGNATTSVITPLQNAINSAQNASELQSAVGNYCIFDGCQNGVNYHLEARYGIGVINALLEKVQSNPNVTANYTANLTIAQNDINISASTLALVGTKVYTTGQMSTIFTNIRSAALVIKSLLKIS